MTLMVIYYGTLINPLAAKRFLDILHSNDRKHGYLKINSHVIVEVEIAFHDILIIVYYKKDISCDGAQHFIQCISFKIYHVDHKCD